MFISFFSQKRNEPKKKVVAAQFPLKGVLTPMLCFPKINMLQLLDY